MTDGEHALPLLYDGEEDQPDLLRQAPRGNSSVP